MSMKTELHHTSHFGADLLVIGGGLGGCAAALSACRLGKRVVMTEETRWIGGQLTSQAVPPDENPWVEHYGSTETYRELRNRIRGFYQRNFVLSYKAAKERYFDPGHGHVGRLCHEMPAALAALNEMLSPYTHSGQLTVLTEHKAVRTETDSDQVKMIEVINRRTGDSLHLSAPFVVDATEEGDLLPLSGTEYRIGAESQSQTGEPHALSGDPDPEDMQAITYCFAMDYDEKGDHTIPEPEMYSFWKNYREEVIPDGMLVWGGFDHPQYGHVDRCLFPHANHVSPWDSLWEYRRIIDKTSFAPGTYASDITLVNWVQNDYFLEPIIDVPEEERGKRLYQAKQLSLSLLYWLQTEAERPDGGCGYPGLRLRADLVGTDDGLAMYPYIRESRRILARFTITESHVSRELLGDQGPYQFEDSVGIGSYGIDIHMTTKRRHLEFPQKAYPFEIPLGALIPQRVRNLLPGCKNIGTTHISNGCYRLHPVEWNIGEAVGALAAFCLDKSTDPHSVYEKETLRRDFLRVAENLGILRHWPWKDMNLLSREWHPQKKQ